MNLDDLPEIKPDLTNFYREETFTDRRVGILRRLTPVSKDGSTDPNRPVLYLGQTQLMTQMGALPISFEIPASSFEDALDSYADAAKEGIRQTLEELQELRREAASSIYVPEPGAGGMGGLGGAGGMPGGGKIQMP